MLKKDGFTVFNFNRLYLFLDEESDTQMSNDVLYSDQTDEKNVNLDQTSDNEYGNGHPITF